MEVEHNMMSLGDNGIRSKTVWIPGTSDCFRPYVIVYRYSRICFRQRRVNQHESILVLSWFKGKRWLEPERDPFLQPDFDNGGCDGLAVGPVWILTMSRPEVEDCEEW